MELEKYIVDDYVIITPFYIKKRILKEVTKQKKIAKAKFFDLKKIIEGELEYSPLSIYEIMKEKRVSPTLGYLYLDNIRNVEEKNYQNEKLDALVCLRKMIIEKGYVFENKIQKSFFKNKRIVIYGYPYFTKKEQKWIDGITKENEVIIEKKDKTDGTFYLQKFDKVEEEVSVVAEKILHALKEGTSLDHIKLFVPNRDYISAIHRIFALFKIPASIKEQKSLLSYDMTRYFKELLQKGPVDESLEIIRETYDLTNPFLASLYSKITSIVTPFLGIDEKEIQVELILYLLKKETILKDDETSCIKMVPNLEDAGIDDKVFVLGLHMGSYPVLYKDDDYLSDTEKVEIDLETSKEKNKNAQEKALYIIESLKDVHISYASRSMTREYVPSSLISLLKERVPIKEGKGKYSYSSYIYNQYILSHELDLFMKYNQKSDILPLLYNGVKVPYKEYKNQYNGIHIDHLERYLNSELSLSYSTVDLFYKCQFRFYVSSILKIYENKKPTISQIVGNMVHEILCRLLKEKIIDDQTLIDEVMEKYLNENDISARERFYKRKYKKEIIKLIEIIKEQRKQTDFCETYFEDLFSVHIKRKLDITIKGYIDKVLTFRDETSTYVIVIDYKTGVITPNFNLVVHGLNMQLLLYYYLLQKQDSSYQFAGSYWQNIMKDILPAEKGKTYDMIRREAYKWNGYSIKDIHVIRHIDTDLENGFIQSMKLKKDGDFGAYAKVITEEEVNALLKIVDEKLENAIFKIEKGDFIINPKRIGIEQVKDATGCAFCPYRDICFRKNEDIVSLKEYKKLEFIGDKNE